MARNRMLNPEFWLDEELATISPHARLLYQGLWGICDDNNATLPNRPEWIKAQIFPYEKVDTRRLLDECSRIGKIILFKENDQEYWYIKNFFKYQKIDRPSKEKFPPFSEANSIKTRRALDEPSTSPRAEVKLSKDNGISKKTIENDSYKYTALELWELGKRLDVALPYITETYQELLEHVKDGTYKKKWSALSHKTLAIWVRRGIKKGEIPNMNEMEKMDLKYFHPDHIKKRDEEIKQLKERGIL